MPDPVRGPNTESNQFVTGFSVSSKTDLLLGTLDVEDRHDYNAAVLISGGTHQMQIYRKVHLVPFGEYIPLRHSFPLFAAVASRWVPGDFDVGRDYTLFRLTNGVEIAPLICFEDTIGDLARQFVLRGANLLVIVGTDLAGRTAPAATTATTRRATATTAKPATTVKPATTTTVKH